MARAPRQPRRLPHERAWNVALRTLHLMAFGVLLGGHVWGVPAEALWPALGLTVASGAALMGLELYREPRWLFLGKGLMVLAKLAVLLLVPVFWEARVPLLLLVVALASVGAHMPSRYRHYSVLHRCVLPPGPAAPACGRPAASLVPQRALSESPGCEEGG
jgi:hypothetical protein